MGQNGVRQLSLAKTTGQSLLSLAFDLGGVLAGLVVAISLGLFSQAPWIIALYPGVLSIRGVIGGLFSGRLSTGLHLGTIEAKIFGKEAKGLRSLWSSVTVLTLEGATLLGLVALLFGTTLWGINMYDWLIIYATTITTMGLSLLLISPITILVAFSSFKRGLDPDIVVYPVVATIADILVTLCYAFVLSLFFVMGGLGAAAAMLVCLGFAIVVLLIGLKNRGEVMFVKTLKEATITMIIVAFIVSITGSMLSRISNVLMQRAEVTLARVYLVYTALLSTMGDFGAIIGSTATTKLALGAMDSSIRSLRKHKNQIIGAWIASLAVYVILTLISATFAGPTSVLGGLRFGTALLATNALTAVAMTLIAFSIAVLTFHRGLDPDNFVIPIESALADAVTTVFLLLTLSLMV